MTNLYQKLFPGGKHAGFTLIELLVVVLIIGILAAVSVPQYQKAVQRARFTQIITAANALYQAQKAFFMANGEYATLLSQLDISFPNQQDSDTVLFFKSGNCYLESGRVICESGAGRDLSISWSVFYKDGSRWCCAYDTDNYAASSLCSQTIPGSASFNGCGDGGYCKCWRD